MLVVARHLPALKLKFEANATDAFSSRQDLEQQLVAAAVELHVAEIVNQQQVQAAVAADEAGEASFVGGFDESV